MPASRRQALDLDTRADLALAAPADLALAAAMGGMLDEAEGAAAAGGLTGDAANDALLREFMADLEDEAMGGDSGTAAASTSFNGHFLAHFSPRTRRVPCSTSRPCWPGC